MAEVHGTYEPRFEPVRATLADQLETGADLGASVAVFLHGEPVVDIWGGWADVARRAPGRATPSPTSGPPRRP